MLLLAVIGLNLCNHKQLMYIRYPSILVALSNIMRACMSHVLDLKRAPMMRRRKPTDKHLCVFCKPGPAQPGTRVWARRHVSRYNLTAQAPCIIFNTIYTGLPVNTSDLRKFRSV